MVIYKTEWNSGVRSTNLGLTQHCCKVSLSTSSLLYMSVQWIWTVNKKIDNVLYGFEWDKKKFLQYFGLGIMFYYSYQFFFERTKNTWRFQTREGVCWSRIARGSDGGVAFLSVQRCNAVADNQNHLAEKFAIKKMVVRRPILAARVLTDGSPTTSICIQGTTEFLN
jgi:hypothetical protein